MAKIACPHPECNFRAKDLTGLRTHFYRMHQPDAKAKIAFNQVVEKWVKAHPGAGRPKKHKQKVKASPLPPTESTDTTTPAINFCPHCGTNLWAFRAHAEMIERINKLAGG